MSRASGNRVLSFGPAALLIAAVAPALPAAQSAPAKEPPLPRILKQDPSLNNLVDPPGYATAKLGTLGAVLKAGKGDRDMILIPGAGFGGTVFKELMDRLADDYRMYAVTLPGFGGTPAPPAPDEKTSFGAQTWTNSALEAIEKLIADEKLHDVVVVGHWITGTQIAVRLANRHPETVKAVALIAGTARIVSTNEKLKELMSTPEKRAKTVDTYSAPMWFKTVTRETWDDNSFIPGDYAVHPVRAQRLWREAASPLLHVWVRYLCEFNAQDLASEVEKLRVRTLLLKPGFEDLIHPDSSAMDAYCNKSWDGLVEKSPMMTVKTIAKSRVCMWFDQPAEVQKAITEFVKQAG